MVCSCRTAFVVALLAVFAVVLRSPWVRALLAVNQPFEAARLAAKLHSVRRESRSAVSVTRVSADLPMFEVEGLLSPGEADFLVDTYTPFMYSCGERAPEGCSELQVLFHRGIHELLASIEQRVYSLLDGLCTTSPCESGGPMNWQIVKYSRGGHFQRHVDGAIPLTFMAYLSDGEDGQGGSTHFPFVAPANDAERETTRHEKDIYRRVLEAEGLPPSEWPPPPSGKCVRPKKATVLMWCSCLSDGSDEPNKQATHQGMPIAHGHKYILNMFFNDIDTNIDVKKACRLLNSEGFGAGGAGGGGGGGGGSGGGETGGRGGSGSGGSGSGRSGSGTAGSGLGFKPLTVTHLL
jgi:hypothetical protein